MIVQSDAHSTSLRRRLIIVGIVLLCFIIAAFFFLRGHNTITGTFPANVKAGSSVCVKDKTNYPYTDDANKTKHEGSLRVVATFDESKRIQKIALDYIIYYSDHEAAIYNEPFLATGLGKRLDDDKLPYDEFGNKFSIIDNKVTMSLVANMGKVTNKNYKYLLLDSNPNNDLLLYEFKKTFENKGFECTSTDEQ